MDEDVDARAGAKAINELRALELTLVSAGNTRAQARQRINKIKGTPGAVLSPTPGAGDDWLGSAAGLIAAIQK